MNFQDLQDVDLANVKASSQLEGQTWEEPKVLGAESQQSISGLLTEAIAEYLQRRRVRPEVRAAVTKSIENNRRLGELLGEFGAPEGVRDLGLLESVLYRPRTGYYEELVEMAAALFESLLMNRPFVDGYRRVAFSAVGIFLRINVFRIDVGADSAHRRIIEIIGQGRKSQ